jgi:hypothetical protein
VGADESGKEEEGKLATDPHRQGHAFSRQREQRSHRRTLEINMALSFGHPNKPFDSTQGHEQCRMVNFFVWPRESPIGPKPSACDPCSTGISSDETEKPCLSQRKIRQD